MMHHLYLVACSKRKAKEPCAAKDLYQGTLFKASRAYAEAHGGHWRILSAQHGVVHPDTVIAPYDLCLANHPHLDDWQRDILEQLRKEDLSGGVIFLCGVTYRTWLEAMLMTLDVAVYRSPLEGLGLGQQVAYLRQYSLPLKNNAVSG